MPLRTKSFWTDLFERAGWTAVQAALAVGVTTFTELEHAWAIPIAAGLSALKTEVKKHIDDRKAKQEKPSDD